MEQGELMSLFVEELTPPLIKELAETAICEPRIANWAERLRDLPLESANLWVEGLTQAGEDLALSTLLSVLAYSGVVLDPEVLVRSGMVASNIACLPFIFAHQNASVIPHLCRMARSEELSIQRQILYGRMAAEMTLRHGEDDEKVKRLLQYLSGVADSRESKMMVHETLKMLRSGKLERGLFPIFTDLKIKGSLPERPPPKVISTGGTLRRPVAKVGRNDPCHCGSGKKYKRCCCSEDEKLLADASEHAGITQTQLQENPGIVDDPMLIKGMRAYEIKKLDPSALGGRQLMEAYRRAVSFGLFEIAFNMLVECSGRTNNDFEFNPGHFVDFMDHALNSAQVEVAERARRLIPADYDLIDWDNVEMEFALHTAPGVLVSLEKRCAAALHPEGEYDLLHDYDLCNLTHLLHRKFPALSILFARAAVVQRPDREMDNELLVEIVHQCRVDLGLAPWDDPIAELVRAGEQTYHKQHQELKHADIESELRQELAAAREQAKLSASKLTEADAELQKMKKELVVKEKNNKGSDEKPAAAPQEPSPEQRATMERLRRQIDNLKVEIGNQQEQRRKLHQQLEREQRSERNQVSASRSVKSDESDEQVEMPTKSERNVVIPEYKESFKSACSSMPVAVTGAALKAIAGIAAYDAATWRNFSSIKQLSNIYRIRIGIHYRLLLLWLPGERLCALDLIPRQDLESWIKRHAT